MLAVELQLFFISVSRLLVCWNQTESDSNPTNCFRIMSSMVCSCAFIYGVNLDQHNPQGSNRTRGNKAFTAAWAGVGAGDCLSPAPWLLQAPFVEFPLDNPFLTQLFLFRSRLFRTLSVIYSTAFTLVKIMVAADGRYLMNSFQRINGILQLK